MAIPSKTAEDNGDAEKLLGEWLTAERRHRHDRWSDVLPFISPWGYAFINGHPVAWPALIETACDRFHGFHQLDARGIEVEPDNDGAWFLIRAFIAAALRENESAGDILMTAAHFLQVDVHDTRFLDALCSEIEDAAGRTGRSLSGERFGKSLLERLESAGLCTVHD